MGRWVQYIFGLLGLSLTVAAPCHAVFFPYQKISIGSSASVVAIGDLTGDGRADVAVATRASGDVANDRSVFVFRQTAQGALAPPARYFDGIEARGIAIGDLNGDGRADLAICGDDGVAVLRQNATGSLAPQFIYTGPGADSVAIGDLNGDGRADLAVSHADSAQITLLYQTPAGGLDSPVRYRVSDAGDNEIAIGDLTGDGLPDLLFMRGLRGRGTLSLLPQDGTTHRLGAARRYGWGEDLPSHGVALADLNGDRRLDVAVTWGDHRPDCGLGVFYQAAGDGLEPARQYGSADAPGPVVAGDLNGDGRADLMVAHPGWQSLSIYLQLPGGGFSPEQLESIPYNDQYEPQGLAVGDIDGDGWPDVALADDSHGLVLLYNAGNQDITPPTTQITAHPPDVSRQTMAVFRFAGSDSTTPVTGLQYRWNLDLGAWGPFSDSTTATLTNLSEGWHDFSVAARDAAGNVDPTPAVFHFGVDRTPPTNLILSGVGSYTAATGVSVIADATDNMTAEEDLTFAWRVDAGPWSDLSYAWKITLSALLEGAHTLEARAADPAGNLSAPAAVRFIVDRTPPETRVDRVSRDPSTGTVTVTFSGSDNLPPPNSLTYSWRLDGGAWSPYTAATQASLPPLAAGSHRFEVRARDSAGNVDPTPAAQGL